jgi:predicted phage terminase large subunit-like protein
MNETLQNLPNEIDPEILKRILKDRKALTEITRRSFFYFFYIYFGRYIKYPIAPIHYEMFGIGQDEKIKFAGVMTFRNSAKSTILNTAYALWSIMGTPQKKHVVIASQTQQRAKDHLMNIRKEIEENKLLSENLGPFEEREDRWHATTLIVHKYGARISAISTEEGIRGLREGPYRPDLIIADDIEDSNSAKNQDGRDKTFNWFTGELLPLGDINTKIIILGNFLHQDSVLSRFEKMIEEGKMKGVFLRIPLIDEDNVIAWPGKFTSLEAIKELKQSIGNEIVWQREYLLKNVPSENQIILEEWLKEYPVMPNLTGDDYIGTFIGVDPAGSDDENADYTAMVAASVFGRGKEKKIYIHPNPVNKQLRFNGIKDQAILLSKTLGGDYPATVIMEDVGIQKWLTQELKDAGIPVEDFKVAGMNKRERLNIAASQMQAGRVFFPKDGVKDLRLQLLNFGSEKHDDLADAFTTLILKIMSYVECGHFGKTIVDNWKPITAGLLGKQF